MRKPLSMKRLTVLANNYSKEKGAKKGWDEWERLKEFLDYVWIHKNDELY